MIWASMTDKLRASLDRHRMSRMPGILNPFIRQARAWDRPPYWISKGRNPLLPGLKALRKHLRYGIIAVLANKSTVPSHLVGVGVIPDGP